MLLLLLVYEFIINYIYISVLNLSHSTGHHHHHFSCFPPLLPFFNTPSKFFVIFWCMLCVCVRSITLCSVFKPFSVSVSTSFMFLTMQWFYLSSVSVDHFKSLFFLFCRFIPIHAYIRIICPLIYLLLVYTHMAGYIKHFLYIYNQLKIC